MAQPQLSVRSSKARDLAHRLAVREKRTIADVVERALEAYELRETGRAPAADFFRRLVEENPIDHDVEWDEVLALHRRPHRGPAL